MWKFYIWVLDRYVEIDICKDEYSIKCYFLSLFKLLIMWILIFLFFISISSFWRYEIFKYVWKDILNMLYVIVFIILV